MARQKKNIGIIQEEGLHRMSRQQVYLSADRETALKVGQRHGKPVVFEVQAKDMHGDGYAFYVAANGVWLAEAVPVIYLKLQPAQQDKFFSGKYGCRDGG